MVPETVLHTQRNFLKSKLLCVLTCKKKFVWFLLQIDHDALVSDFVVFLKSFQSLYFGSKNINYPVFLTVKTFYKIRSKMFLKGQTTSQNVDWDKMFLFTSRIPNGWNT